MVPAHHGSAEVPTWAGVWRGGEVEVTPKAIFTRWSQLMEADPQGLCLHGWSPSSMRVSWSIQGHEGGAWGLQVGDRARFTEGVPLHADCEVEMNSDDFVALAAGALNPQLAYSDGRLRVKGKLGSVLALNVVLDRLVQNRVAESAPS